MCPETIETHLKDQASQINFTEPDITGPKIRNYMKKVTAMRSM